MRTRIATVIACGLFMLAGWWGMSSAAGAPSHHSVTTKVERVQARTHTLERFAGRAPTAISRTIRSISPPLRKAKLRYWKRKLAQITRVHYRVPEWPWGALASCESGRRWHYNGSSGFDGGLQHHPGTWSAFKLPGYPRYAWEATPLMQVKTAERVLAAQGWGAWPACARRLGLR